MRRDLAIVSVASYVVLLIIHVLGAGQSQANNADIGCILRQTQEGTPVTAMLGFMIMISSMTASDLILMDMPLEFVKSPVIIVSACTIAVLASLVNRTDRFASGTEDPDACLPFLSRMVESRGTFTRILFTTRLVAAAPFVLLAQGTRYIHLRRMSLRILEKLRSSADAARRQADALDLTLRRMIPAPLLQTLDAHSLHSLAGSSARRRAL